MEENDEEGENKEEDKKENKTTEEENSCCNNRIRLKKSNGPSSNIADPRTHSAVVSTGQWPMRAQRHGAEKQGAVSCSEEEFGMLSVDCCNVK